LDSTHLSTGETEIQIYEGITAKYNGTIVRLAVDFPSILQIVIEISKEFVIEIASGLIAAWLYEKLKGKDVKKYELIGVR